MTAPADRARTSEHPPHLVLVGLMGAGKTTVGRRCSELLDRALIDTDELVEIAAGASVAEIFAVDGEGAFRTRERAAVGDAVASPTPVVIACGGGVVLDAVNRNALRERGVVVWLDGPSDVLAARIGADTGRPLLGSRDRTATLERLAQDRADAYAACAHARLDTTALDTEETAKAVLAIYEERRHGA